MLLRQGTTEVLLPRVLQLPVWQHVLNITLCSYFLVLSASRQGNTFEVNQATVQLLFHRYSQD